MDQSRPESIETLGEFLAIRWEDGHESLVSVSGLRDACPCAACRGEPDLFGRMLPPADKPVIIESSYQLAQLVPVGHYGLQAYWGDGHNTGIYMFETLRSLCECDVCCAKHRTKPDRPK